MAAQTDVALKATATLIRNETTPGANTATRVGTLLEDFVDSKINPVSLTGVLIGNATSSLLTVTGTASQLFRRNAGNTAYEFFTIAGSDITGAALTKTDDTNVTLTLGGTPTTALLRAASLTLGWTGTLAASRGGTGIGSYTTGNYINALNATTLQQRTPAQVLTDIGAAATSHNNAASTITAGTFATGDFIFPGNLDINGQVASPTNARGNITGATTINWNDGNVQSATLTGNVTFTFSNPKSGASYQLILTQDATGSRTITWPTIHWKGKTTPVLTGTLNSKDIFTITYDGTNYNGNMSENYGTP